MNKSNVLQPFLSVDQIIATQFYVFIEVRLGWGLYFLHLVPTSLVDSVLPPIRRFSKTQVIRRFSSDHGGFCVCGDWGWSRIGHLLRKTVFCNAGNSVIGTRVRTSPGWILIPDAIAENFWYIAQQPRNNWTQELDCRPWVENW